MGNGRYIKMGKKGHYFIEFDTVLDTNINQRFSDIILFYQLLNFFKEQNSYNIASVASAVCLP